MSAAAELRCADGAIALVTGTAASPTFTWQDGDVPARGLGTAPAIASVRAWIRAHGGFEHAGEEALAILQAMGKAAHPTPAAVVDGFAAGAIAACARLEAVVLSITRRDQRAPLDER